MKHLKKFESNENDFFDIQIKLSDFAYFVDDLNSGSDRDTIYYYLEKYLKNKNIIIDIENEIRNEDDDD